MDQVVLRAVKEEEHCDCGIFGKAPVSSDPDMQAEEDDFLGCVSPNFWGTNFTLYDSGTGTKKILSGSPAISDFPVRERTSIAQIGFETNLLGECPRKISVDMTRDGKVWRMENLQPRWDNKIGSYALPFFGRVKLASAKNFQLVTNADQNTIYLMFGKIKKDVFCLDFRAPLTAVDAFAIAIASLAKKRAVS